MSEYDAPRTRMLGGEVAAVLRGRVGRFKVTQSDLAAVTGISQSQVSKILRGVASVDVDELDALCEALGLSISDVIREADEQTSARSGSKGYIEEDHAAVGSAYRVIFYPGQASPPVESDNKILAESQPLAKRGAVAKDVKNAVRGVRRVPRSGP